MALVVAPDRGWAWVVAMAACIINMILSGISRMIGILYVAVLEEYGVSRQEATLPFSVRNTVRCLAGPIVGLIGQRYSIKSVTFIGGILASLGACLCSIAPNIFWITVFWGGLHGLGFAFANTLFQVIVNQYFEKHRATASGIALSGACVGSLGFPFMIEKVLSTYSLVGAFLILGGVVMHVLPPALILSPPPWATSKKSATTTRETAVSSTQPLPDTEIQRTPSYRAIRSLSLTNCPVDGIALRNIIPLFNSISVAEQEESAVEQTETIMEQAGSIVERVDVPDVSQSHPDLENMSNHEEKAINEKWQNDEIVVYVNRNTNSHNNHLHDEVTVNDKNIVQCTGQQTSTIDRPVSNSFMAGVHSMVRLYTNPLYLLISIGMATYVIIFIPVLTVIVDYGKDKGIDETNGKYLLSSMALGDLVGRLGFGWVTDRGFMTISRFFTTTMVLQAVFVSLFPLANGIVSFVILLALYGMVAGSMLILFPILVFKYVSMDDQPVAMGCVGVFSGIVTLGVPSLIGHFRDNTGSYDGMFYVIGMISLLSGALWFLEPVLAKREDKKKMQHEDEKRIQCGDSKYADNSHENRVK